MAAARQGLKEGVGATGREEGRGMHPQGGRGKTRFKGLKGSSARDSEASQLRWLLCEGELGVVWGM